VVVRFRGLACLRWHESGIYFGSRDIKTKWNASKNKELQQLFRELERYRHRAGFRNPKSVVSSAGRALAGVFGDAGHDQDRFDAGSTICVRQVLATTAGEHRFLDVLSVTRAGRLAILELKTVEHPVFLLQRKYWQILAAHSRQEQEDVPRYGYFPVVAPQSAPPVVSVVLRQ
jgi:hypothetical protein